MGYFPPQLLNAEKSKWRSPQPKWAKEHLRHDHHIVAVRNLRDEIVGALGGHEPTTFEVTFPNEWTVDVHDGCHCRRNKDGKIQTIADRAADHIEHILREATSITPESDDSAFIRIDDYILKNFEAGLYPIVLVLNEAVRDARKRRGEREKEIEILGYQLSARAGIRGKVPLNLGSFCDGFASNDPKSLLHVANHLTNVGRYADADATQQRAREIAGNDPAYELDFALRGVQIDRSFSAALTAVRMAESESALYRQTTAKVLAGLAGLSTNATRSREFFEEVLTSDGEISWLYRAESWFALGYMKFQANQLRDAYRYLIASQFVYGFLGLQPMAHPEFAVPGAKGPTILPSHLLRHDSFSSLSEDDCRNLRHVAIIAGKVRDSLTQEFAGLPGTVVGAPDPLRVAL